MSNWLLGNVATCTEVYYRSDQANKCFSSAVQLHDNLVKAWAAWGDYLDQLFSTEKSVSVYIFTNCSLLDIVGARRWHYLPWRVTFMLVEIKMNQRVVSIWQEYYGCWHMMMTRYVSCHNVTHCIIGMLLVCDNVMTEHIGWGCW